MVNINTENKTGADCSGSSGGSNRVLTLSNTGTTTGNGFLVYVSGLALALTTEYTVVHNSTASEITFLNGMWDDMTIVVQYWQSALPGLGTDFENGPLNDFGVSVVRTPVTVAKDNVTGDKTYTDGTDATIQVVFQNADTKYNLAQSGIAEIFDAKIWLLPDETINKYDKITYDGRVYRVDEVSTRHFNGTTMYKMATLFFID